MTLVPPALRAAVVARADDWCVYCGLSQAGQEATFHADHVVPRAAGGTTRASNLALACVACSLFKGARQTAADPRTGRPTPLFNPRRQRWMAHFRGPARRPSAAPPSAGQRSPPCR